MSTNRQADKGSERAERKLGMKGHAMEAVVMEAGVRIGDGGTVYGEVELGRLGELEGKIVAAGRAVVEAGKALREIRDTRLYIAAGWGTFESYCQEKLDMRRETVDRMIRGADVAVVLDGAGRRLPSDYAMRVLAPFVTNPIGLVEAYDRAAAMSGGGMITGVLLERAVAELTGAVDVDASSPVDVDADVAAPVGPVSPAAGAPAGSAGEVDWDAVIREAVEESRGARSGGSGDGSGGGVLTDAQRLSRLEKTFGHIAVLSARARELVSGLSEDSVEAEETRADAVNASVMTAVGAFEDVCDAIQSWYAGDEAGLPSPDVSSAIPEPFKF